MKPQIETEYGDEIFCELVMQSMLNWKYATRDQQGLILVNEERRKLACQMLISYSSCPEMSVDKYFLAVTIMGRILRHLQDEENFAHLLEEEESFSLDPTTELWILVVAVIRLAAKYEGDYGGYNGYNWAYKMYLGPSSNVTANRWQAFEKMVNEAEKVLLSILGYDLVWPTPMPFVRKLLGPGAENTTLARTVETILIIASVHDFFERFPVHVIAAASYNLGRKLLGVVPQAAPVSLQRASEVGLSLPCVTRQLESVMRAELSSPFPWLISNVAGCGIRWAKVLLACPANGDWGRCRYRLQNIHRFCRNRIETDRPAKRSRLVQSIPYEGQKTVERFWEAIPPFLVCRRQHYGRSETVRTQWLTRLEAFHVRVADGDFVDDQYQPPTPINLLPAELLFNILAKLDEVPDRYHCMLVSKKWAENAVRLLWEDIECDDPQDYDTICRALSSRSARFSYHSFIRKLTLAALSANINDKSVLPLAGCTGLEYLDLHASPDLTDAGLIALLEGFSQLDLLVIRGNNQITGRSMHVIASTCKKLTSLTLLRCNNISNESLVDFFASCTSITKLCLYECTQIQDSTVQAFVRNRPVIHKAVLGKCERIGDKSVTSLLSTGTQLQLLNLNGSKRITDKAFLDLPSSLECKYLKRVALVACESLGDAGVQKIVNLAPNLHLLRLGECPNLTDNAVRSICKLGKNLLSIDLSGCGRLTDAAIKGLANHCIELREVKLSHCTLLTDDSVASLAQLQGLQDIVLDYCGITSKSILALTRCNSYEDFPKIREPCLRLVSLEGCSNVTLQSIVWLLKSNPGLSRLGLRGVAALRACGYRDEIKQQPEVAGVFSGKSLSQFRDYLYNLTDLVGAMETLSMV